MKRRLFIALNLPEALKDSIEKEVEKIRYKFVDDIRFLDRKQWHITVSFLGHQQDVSLGKIIDSMKLAGKTESPEIRFEDFSYGPKNGPPRMIWLNGDAGTAERINLIKQIFEDNLISRGINLQRREYKKYHPHITLAKFKNADNLTDISAGFAKSFRAQSLDLMESHMSKTGSCYEILQKIKFPL